MRSVSAGQLVVHAATDQGLQRERNEDFHGWHIPDDGETLKRRGVLLVVADGMGGIERGEIASRRAVEAVLQSYRTPISDSTLDDLRQALESANKVVNDEKNRHVGSGPMGATCTAAVVRGRFATLAHVGDSRAYLVRRRVATQLTLDHTLAAQLVREKRLSPEAERFDRRRNIVMRGLGIEPIIHVDAFPLEMPLEPGDSLLLCTDGLHGQLTGEEIGDLADHPDPATACRDLIGLANERGGPDNITVILARVGAGGRTP